MAPMTDRPTLIELVREPPLAWIVLNHPEKLNAWSWESARQITAHAESLRFAQLDPNPVEAAVHNPGASKRPLPSTSTNTGLVNAAETKPGAITSV
jgi:hypothetical protein